jgi:hypothetical protein
LEVAPPLIDFGQVPVSGDTVEQVVTVTNSGGLTTTVTLRLDSGAPFDVSDQCGALEPGQSCDAVVQFTPAEPGDFTDTLHVEHSGGSDSIDVPISAAVPSPPETTTAVAVIGVDPTDLRFDDVQFSDGVVQRSVSISNTGTAAAEITTTLEDGSLFVIAQACESVGPGASCEVIVKFAATKSGEFTDVLHVDQGDGDRIDVPVDATVPPTPDLGAEIRDFGGATTEESNGVRYWVLPITVVIRNSGEEAVREPFRLTVETGSRREPILLPASTTDKPFGDAFVEDAVDPGKQQEIQVFVAFDMRIYAERDVVDVRVVADSCTGDAGFDVPPCRIVEENETNNVSADFPVRIELNVE